jgi:hypothetical protein
VAPTTIATITAAPATLATTSFLDRFGFNIALFPCYGRPVGGTL